MSFIKKTLLLLFLCFHFNSYCTNWLQYFIFVEKEYVHGTWKDDSILRDLSTWRYLDIVEHSYLSSSDEKKTKLPQNILAKLKENCLNSYDWDYMLEVNNNIVSLTFNDSVVINNKAKNEIVSSMVLNGFDGVKINDKYFDLRDLTLPYLSLKIPHISKSILKEKIAMENENTFSCDKTNQKESNKNSLTKKASQKVGKKKNEINTLFVLSIIVNIFLILITIYALRKKRA